jgi:hypothetical protein
MDLGLLLLSIGAASMTGTATLAYRDYHAWRALGPGGLPPTWRGWWRATRWRAMARSPFELRTLRKRSSDPSDVATLDDLRPRRGDRPRIGPHPVPHRQLSDHAPEHAKTMLRKAFDARVEADPERLMFARSHFEKHNEAVTLRPALCRHGDARRTRGEIGHIHPSDGSMHVVLSASDAIVVIERGWGQLHGLAGFALDLPLTYTLIYAPRDEQEAAIDGRILDAAISYMTGAGMPDRAEENPAATA